MKFVERIFLWFSFQMSNDESEYELLLKKTLQDLSNNFQNLTLTYERYAFFAISSALFGIPSNILLLVILIRINLFTRRRSAFSSLSNQSTGSFNRFLFEVVVVDTLLLLYHFIDNFLSFITADRSAGQHYLIHVSDFCCKFFTYIAKMSVLLVTWLLLFLILNRLILTMDFNHNRQSIWNRGLHYINAKYSTVFLVFIFSVYNIFPIEILVYRDQKNVIDYEAGRNFHSYGISQVPC